MLTATAFAAVSVAGSAASALPMETGSPFVFDASSEAARRVFGDAPQLELLHENNEYPFAHEAGVFIPTNNSLYITSNQFTDRKTGQKSIRITRVKLNREGSKLVIEEVAPNNVTMANGGVNYNHDNKDGILFCAQGDFQNPGGLVFMDKEPPYNVEVVVSSFKNKEFNSPNDVVVHTRGFILFTDPTYGFQQGIRPSPALDNQVYRYDPSDGAIDAVPSSFAGSDIASFVRPNGVAFSPDERFAYITDTGRILGNGTEDANGRRDIYTFEVFFRDDGKLDLRNGRLFARAEVGIPDGIKCDVHGNVYSGCGDGVNVWAPTGAHLGLIKIEGTGAANFCFGREGEIFILGEHRLWRARLARTTKGALLGI